jgi:hypothetical protein
VDIPEFGSWPPSEAAVIVERVCSVSLIATSVCSKSTLPVMCEYWRGDFMYHGCAGVVCRQYCILGGFVVRISFLFVVKMSTGVDRFGFPNTAVVAVVWNAIARRYVVL